MFSILAWVLHGHSSWKCQCQPCHVVSLPPLFLSFSCLNSFSQWCCQRWLVQRCHRLPTLSQLCPVSCLLLPVRGQSLPSPIGFLSAHTSLQQKLCQYKGRRLSATHRTWRAARTQEELWGAGPAGCLPCYLGTFGSWSASPLCQVSVNTAVRPLICAQIYGARAQPHSNLPTSRRSLISSFLWHFFQELIYQCGFEVNPLLCE